MMNEMDHNISNNTTIKKHTTSELGRSNTSSQIPQKRRTSSQIIKFNEESDKLSHDIRIINLKSLEINGSWYQKCILVGKTIRNPTLGSLSFFSVGHCIRIMTFIDRNVNIIDTRSIHDIYESDNKERFEYSTDLLGGQKVCKKKINILYGPSYNTIEKISLIFIDLETTRDIRKKLINIVFKKRWSIVNFLESKMKDWIFLMMHFSGTSIKMSKMHIFLKYFDSQNSFKCLKLLRLNKLTKMHRIYLEKLSFHIFMKIYVHLNYRSEISAFHKSFIDSQNSKDLSEKTENNLIDYLTNLNADPETMLQLKYVFKLMPLSSNNIHFIIAIVLMSFPFCERYIYNQTSYNELDFRLSDYFVASSHNTYLVDNQFGGYASYQPYRFSLLSGIRSIELDVYDSVNDSNQIIPIITHTKYLQVKPVTLESVLKAIESTAFVVSKFPIILSIENHLSQRGQRISARIMREIFGWRIIDHVQYLKMTQNGKVELRLSDCMGRIFIKAKRNDDQISNRTTNGPQITNVNENNEYDDSLSNAKHYAAHQNTFNAIEPEFSSLVSHYCSVPYANICIVEGQNVKTSQVQSAKIDESIKTTINSEYRAGDHDNDNENNKLHHDNHYDHLNSNHNIVSISENVKLPGINYQKNDSQQTINLNLVSYLSIFSQNSLRIYPKYTRIRSSNYNPFKYLTNGVQMIAMNQQTVDRYTKAMQQIFSQNLNQGFVLRPRIFRRASNTDFEHTNEGKIDLNLTLLSILQPSSGKLQLTVYAFNQLKNCRTIKIGGTTKKIKGQGVSDHRRWKVFGQKLQVNFDSIKYAESGYLLMEYVLDKTNRYCLFLPLYALHEGFSHYILPHISMKDQTPPVVLFANCLMKLSSELCDLKIRRVRLDANINDTQRKQYAANIKLEKSLKFQVVRAALHADSHVFDKMIYQKNNTLKKAEKNLSSTLKIQNPIDYCMYSSKNNQIELKRHNLSVDSLSLLSSSLSKRKMTRSVSQSNINSLLPPMDVKSGQIKVQNKEINCHPKNHNYTTNHPNNNSHHMETRNDDKSQIKILDDSESMVNPNANINSINSLIRRLQDTNPYLLDKWDLQVQRIQSMINDDLMDPLENKPIKEEKQHIQNIHNLKISTPKKVETYEPNEIKKLEEDLAQLVGEQCNENLAKGNLDKKTSIQNIFKMVRSIYGDKKHSIFVLEDQLNSPTKEDNTNIEESISNKDQKDVNEESNRSKFRVSKLE